MFISFDFLERISNNFNDQLHFFPILADIIIITCRYYRSELKHVSSLVGAPRGPFQVRTST